MITVIKVSIVVPIYNTKEYLKKCIDSLLDQSLDCMEIILVDDGSTDGSSQLIDQYQNIAILKFFIGQIVGLVLLETMAYPKQKGSISALLIAMIMLIKICI